MLLGRKMGVGNAGNPIFQVPQMEGDKGAGQDQSLPRPFWGSAHSPAGKGLSCTEERKWRTVLYR